MASFDIFFSSWDREKQRENVMLSLCLDLGALGVSDQLRINL